MHAVVVKRIAMSAIAAVSLAAAGLGAPGQAAQPAHAQEPGMGAAQPGLTLMAEDLPAGYVEHSLPMQIGPMQGEVKVFVARGEQRRPWFVESATLTGQSVLVDPTETSAMVRAFRRSFAANGGLQVDDWAERDPGALGERAVMYSFRYRPDETDDSPSASLPDGDGAVIFFERGTTLSILVVLDTQGRAQDHLRRYASIVDARMAQAAPAGPAA